MRRDVTNKIIYFFQSNSVYGKTMQNVREYIEVKLHTTSDSALKAACTPSFKHYSIIDENLVQTNHVPQVIKHNTPMAIGVTILELVSIIPINNTNILYILNIKLLRYFFQSKMIMFDAWYNKMMKTGCSFDLGMTDTDSFLFKVSNPEAFFEKFDQFMDYSNYDKDHEKYNAVNKAKLGFFKDELCGKYVCKEFIGLRSKCYAMNMIDEEKNERKEKKVCKGLGRTAILNRLKFEQYKDCLFKQKSYRHEFHGIRSHNHNIKTVLIRKKAVNYTDTKRWIFDCGIHSVPYGSILIKNNGGKCPRCKKSFDMC